MTALAARFAPARRSSRWLALAARTTFSVLIVGLPFRARVDPLPHPASSVPAILTDLVIYAIDVLAVAVLGMWLLARILDRRPVELGPLAVRAPVAALVVLAWATIPFGVEPVVSVVGAIRLSLGVLLAIYVATEVDGLDSIAVPLGLLLALQSVVAIWQATTGGPIGLEALGEFRLDPDVPGTSVVMLGDGTRLLRAYGLSPHPNILGGILACGLLLLIGVRTSGRAAGLARRGVVLLAAVALVVTFSRGAWLGALAGVVAGFAVLAAGADRRALRTWTVSAALALAVALAAGVAARDAVAARTGLVPTIAPTEVRSVDERLEQIRLGWRVALERPLTGSGASALPIAMRALEPAFAFAFYAPHLVPLAVAGELGLAGGAAYLAMIGAPWALLVRRRRANVRFGPELAGASAALAALTVVSLFDDYPWAGGPGRTLGWLVIGLWVMAWTRADRGRTGRRAPAH